MKFRVMLPERYAHVEADDSVGALLAAFAVVVRDLSPSDFQVCPPEWVDEKAKQASLDL